MSPKCVKCGFQWTSTERSKPQLRYYFGVVLDMISEELGYELQETHELMLGMFLRPMGKETTVGLTTHEFSIYLEKIRRWAVIKHQISIPEPNEETNQKQPDQQT